jgi:teichuronic acid exporter
VSAPAEGVGARVVHGFRWLAAARFAGQLATWVVTIFVIRLLTPDDYGLMAMAGVFTFFVSLFEDLGMGAAITQRKTLDDEHVARMFGVVLIINFIAFALLFLGAGLIAMLFDEPRLTNIVRLLSLQFPAIALQVVPQSLLARRMQFQRTSLITFVSMVAGSLTTLLLALAGYGVWALAWGSLSMTFCRVVGFNIAAGWFHAPSFRFEGMGDAITFGGQVTGQRLLFFVYTQADVFLIGRLLGKEVLGFYSVALHLATLPMSKLSAIINEVSFAGFSRLQADLSEVTRQFGRATNLIALFAFPVFFGIAAVAPEAVNVVLGEKWARSIVPLQLLSLACPLRMLNQVIASALMGIGRADVLLVNSAITAVLLPIAIVTGLQWGLEGVATAWLLGYLVCFTIKAARALPVLGMATADYLRPVAAIAVCAGAMLGAVLALRMILPDAWSNTLPALVTLIAAGAAVFGLLALAMLRDSVQLALRVLR